MLIVFKTMFVMYNNKFQELLYITFISAELYTPLLYLEEIDPEIYYFSGLPQKISTHTSEYFERWK